MEDRTVELTFKITPAQHKTLKSLPKLAIEVDYSGVIYAYFVHDTDVTLYVIFLDGKYTTEELDQYNGGWFAYNDHASEDN